MIQFEYELDGEVKVIGFQNWNIFNSWLPRKSTKPIKMIVDNKVYTKFDTCKREKFGCDYLEIKPIE